MAEPTQREFKLKLPMRFSYLKQEGDSSQP